MLQDLKVVVGGGCTCNSWQCSTDIVVCFAPSIGKMRKKGKEGEKRKRIIKRKKSKKEKKKKSKFTELLSYTPFMLTC